MKQNAAIVSIKTRKGPFIQSATRDSFIQNNKLDKLLSKKDSSTVQNKLQLDNFNKLALNLYSTEHFTTLNSKQIATICIEKPAPNKSSVDSTNIFTEFAVLSKNHEHEKYCNYEAHPILQKLKLIGALTPCTNTNAEAKRDHVNLLDAKHNNTSADQRFAKASMSLEGVEKFDKSNQFGKSVSEQNKIAVLFKNNLLAKFTIDSQKVSEKPNDEANTLAADKIASSLTIQNDKHVNFDCKEVDTLKNLENCKIFKNVTTIHQNDISDKHNRSMNTGRHTTVNDQFYELSSRENSSHQNSSTKDYNSINVILQENSKRVKSKDSQDKVEIEDKVPLLHGPSLQMDSANEGNKDFEDLQSTIVNHAKSAKSHSSTAIKVQQAQQSSVSPSNERSSMAKAQKIDLLQKVPTSNSFNAEELKASILNEVETLLKTKEIEAVRSEKKPIIDQSDLAVAKRKSNEKVQEKKVSSIGQLQNQSRKQPDDSLVKKRENTELQSEDFGTISAIPNTERAVAKPISDNRISLAQDSMKIDQVMIENDVQEQQLKKSDEPHFQNALSEKSNSQQEAMTLKYDYKLIEDEKLSAERGLSKNIISQNAISFHQVRKEEFTKVDGIKQKTKETDEKKRQDVADHIDSLYNKSEKSVNEKLDILENTISVEFDEKMKAANDRFQNNINTAIDNEFSWESASKFFYEDDYNRRIRKIFSTEAHKFKKHLSEILDPFTRKIANVLNAITQEISVARDSVIEYVKSLSPALQEIGNNCAAQVMSKFNTLEGSVDQKQKSLQSILAKKYSESVQSLESQFKEILNSRKSWLDKAYDSVVGVVEEILKLLEDLKKALHQAAAYANEIIKKPRQFFNNLAQAVSNGFDNFVSNIQKHLITGAIEWITGEMASGGLVIPTRFDFKGILSIVLQVLGITVDRVKTIAKKVIGAKYVALLEKGVDLGRKVGGNIIKIFSILRKEGVVGLWEFIKEQFHDLKEMLLEEAKSFVISQIVNLAVAKLVAMLIPGVGFISAIKSLVDFLMTLFAKARAILSIITGIIASFGEMILGNISKASQMVETTLAKFLSLAITFLAAILGLNGVGKKIADIIEKKIKEPIAKAILKIMEKLKVVMTQFGLFALLDAAEEKNKKGKAWVEQKKESAKDLLSKMKSYIMSKFFQTYKDQLGKDHVLKFNNNLQLERHSVSRDLGNYLLDLESKYGKNPLFKNHIVAAKEQHKLIVVLIGKTVKLSAGVYKGSDKYFGQETGEKLRQHLQNIAGVLRSVPSLDDASVMTIIPKTILHYNPGDSSDGVKATAPLISLDSDQAGSSPAGSDSDLTGKIRRVKKVNSRKVIRGHLINHELFGTGSGTSNLAPITSKANGQMLNEFEEPAKKYVHSGKVIYLKVEYKYAKPNGKNKEIMIKDGITQLPAQVNYTLKKLEYSKNDDMSQMAIDNHNNWTGSGAMKSIKINHDDFF